MKINLKNRKSNIFKATIIKESPHLDTGYRLIKIGELIKSKVIYQYTQKPNL